MHDGGMDVIAKQMAPGGGMTSPQQEGEVRVSETSFRGSSGRLKKCELFMAEWQKSRIC